MTMVTPFPIDEATGRAGQCTSVLLDLKPRDSVVRWAKEYRGGWFWVKRLVEHNGSTLWSVRWPMPKKNAARLYKVITERA